MEENLLMGYAARKKPKGISTDVFEIFPVLKEMLARRAGDLSGGQQQLAIAQALANHFVVRARGEVAKRSAGREMERQNVRACLAV